jgi:hypothetical protein
MSINQEYFDSLIHDPLLFLETVYNLGANVYNMKVYEIYEANKDNLAIVKEKLQEKYPEYKFPEHIFNNQENVKGYPVKLSAYYADMYRQTAGEKLKYAHEVRKYFDFREENEKFVNSLFNRDWWEEIESKYEKLTDYMDTIMEKYEENDSLVAASEFIEKIKDETVEMLEFLNKSEISDEELQHIFNTVCKNNNITDKVRQERIFNITRGMISGLFEFSTKLADLEKMLVSYSELFKKD